MNAPPSPSALARPALAADPKTSNTRAFAFCELRDEWPTLALLTAGYGVWAALIAVPAPLWLGLPALTLVLTLHSSLQHELLHGHPFASVRVNGALGWPPLGLTVPYWRFRALHIAHHRDERLTDPYDDPESHYLDPAVWARLGPVTRALLRANNTLLGRMTLGPAIGMALYWRAEACAILAGDHATARIWVWHGVGAAGVLALVSSLGALSPWLYALACYGAMGVLRIRTFLEHRAHADAAGRTVIIEDRGPLAFLFLHNNLHAVHHAIPGLPWWRLPHAYRTRRTHWLGRNGGYRYRSYAEVFRRHLLRAKDPVPHPLRPAP